MKRKLMYIFKESIDGHTRRNFIESMGSVMSIQELSKFLNRHISGVYRSIRTLKKKKQEELILKDRNKTKYLIITQNELDGKKWFQEHKK